MKEVGIFFLFFIIIIHVYQVINFFIPCLSLRNTENTYGWVLYHIQPMASCDTASIHRFLSVLREQAVDNKYYHLVDMNTVILLV